MGSGRASTGVKRTVYPVYRTRCRPCAMAFQWWLRRRTYLRRYQKMFRGRRRILDIGCGIGEAARWVGGADYFDIDLSETLVQEGRKESKRFLSAASVDVLPFFGVTRSGACEGKSVSKPQSGYQPRCEFRCEPQARKWDIGMNGDFGDHSRF
jgi:SAM-dependent methyltransferase